MSETLQITAFVLSLALFGFATLFLHPALTVMLLVASIAAAPRGRRSRV